MISAKDQEKLRRIDFLKEQVHWMRLATPVMLMIAGVLFYFIDIMGGHRDWSLVIILWATALFMFIMYFVGRKKRIQELKRLREEVFK